MKFNKAVITILFLLCGRSTNSAFVQDNNNNNKRRKTNSIVGRQRHSTFLKAAKIIQPPPPVPPPPPTPPPPSTTSDLPFGIDDIIKDVQNTFTNIQSSLEIPLNIQDQIVSLKEQLTKLDPTVLSNLQTIAKDLQTNIISERPELEPFIQKLSIVFEPLLQSTTISLFVSTIISYSIMTNILNSGQPPAPTTPYTNNKYDAITARAYFDRRLPLVISRGLEILVQSLQFGITLLQDRLKNQEGINEEQRGRELAELLTRLGPTFIKVGQSLSIRTDLLSPAYIRGLATLQDQVPAFPTKIAKEILEKEWKCKLEDVLMDELTIKPVAAASLGQVYKARLRSTGQEVAIKVQRPDILEKIALDMHLVREFGAVLKRFANLNTDTVGTVDAWGTGFIDELDYIQEGINGEMFSSQIANTPLKDVVFAPAVVNEYTTRSVLVTEWVDGERLDRSSSEDVTILCSIAMNTYLTMLLELGLLHCDPHPGNLLRTPDGKLCILDFGMVTRLSKDLQLTLIEHMAHLTSADYAEIPRDLLLLGFVPEDKADVIEDSGVVDVLADIYGAWTGGGGAAAINVNKVIAQLQDLTAEKGNLFRIPPYFAYIAKSFSVLEGIGLSNNPKYSIINECLPYVSKRLLTDKEKMGPALSTFIFGPEKADADRIVNYRRVEQLVEGFGEYTTSASGALLGKENLSRAELLEDAADQILDLVFTEEQTPLQEIFLEQLSKIVSSGGRVVLTRLRERSGTLPSGRTRLGTLLDPLGLFRTSPLVRPNELDEKTVETTQKLVQLMQRQMGKSGNELFDLSTLSREESLDLASILVRKIWSKRRGVLQTSNRFARTLIQLTADKLENGERDTRRIAPAAPSKMDTSNAALPESSVSSPRLEAAKKSLDEVQQTSELTKTHQPNESSRLANARKLLNNLQTEGTNETSSTAEAVSVKN